ncbi:MAG TPA: methyltransferase domain-containing protein [Pseudonocardia sp.]|nr:methyltransferase domain-containing protein [Pseudonocardia sp.]
MIPSTRASSGRAGAGTAAFLRRAVTRQASLGAIAPTFPILARRLADLVPPLPGLRVLELGAGTGAISVWIGSRLGPGARHVALERDPELLATLEHRAPWAERISGDALDLVGRLDSIGLGEVDVVISSLPWGYFTQELQHGILAALCSVLAPGGTFATIACRTARLNPRARTFRAALDASFDDVVVTSTTWANLPPARLLVCRGPRAARPISW